MKVSKIEYLDYIFHVTLIPTWFEKLLGVKEKVERVKKTHQVYVFGGAVYVPVAMWSEGSSADLAVHSKLAELFDPNAGLLVD